MADEALCLKKQNSRGRPLGFKLSDESKDKIRQKRLGTTHTIETKDKISESLAKYFKDRDLLTTSLENDYRFANKEVQEWINTHDDVLNSCSEVLTNKRLGYVTKIEYPVGSNIDSFFGHSITPEFILMLKEELLSEGVETDIEFLLSIL